MNLIEAQKEAVKLMSSHGLDSEGWSFRFSKATNNHGFCNYTRKEITLSRTSTVLRDPDAVRTTILHEIAHALAGVQSSGHGAKWKEIARSLGIENPQACTPTPAGQRIEKKYIKVCPNGHMAQQLSAKMPSRRRRSCSRCNPDRFDARYLIKVKRNPKYRKQRQVVAAQSAELTSYERAA